MATMISVNTAPNGYVFVGPNYRYKTLTQAFNDNQFQVIIPDEYVMEDTLQFNQDVIYSLTTLDEIKISRMNVKTDGTPLYIIFDGHGLITFTQPDPINYINSSNGLALYFNSTRVKSTVDFDITATFLHAANTRFASDFPMTLNSFMDSSAEAITILEGCQFNSVTTLNNTTEADSIVISVSNCVFDNNVIIYCNTPDSTSPGSYTCFIVIDNSILQNLYIPSMGSNVLSPRIRLNNTSMLGIMPEASPITSLFASNINGCSLAQVGGALFPDLLYCNINNNVMDEDVTIRNAEQTTISNNVFNGSIEFESAKLLSFTLNNAKNDVNISVCDSSTIYNNTNMSLSMNTVTDTQITNNNGIDISIADQYTNLSIQSNTFTDNFDLPSGTGLQFCSNNAVQPINMNIPSVTGVIFNGNYNIGVDVASATNGLFANNVGPLFTFNSLTNVYTALNIAI